MCYVLDTCLLRFEVDYPNLVCLISTINVMQDWSRNIYCIITERHLRHTHQNKAQLKMNVALSVDKNIQSQRTLALEP